MGNFGVLVGDIFENDELGINESVIEILEYQYIKFLVHKLFKFINLRIEKSLTYLA